jgi:hypothetical protein
MRRLSSEHFENINMSLNQGLKDQKADEEHE